MKLIKFYFTKISAEKSKNFKPKFGINTNIDITNIESEEIKSDENFDALKVFFKFSIEYLPDTKNEKIGEINLEGTIIFASQKEEIKKIIQEWNNKEKKIPVDFKIPLFNLIFKKCAIKSLELEETLDLPPHLPLPSISFKEDSENKNN